MTTAEQLKAIKKHFIANPYPDGSVVDAFGMSGVNPLTSRAAEAFFSEWRDGEGKYTVVGVVAAFDRAIAKAESSQ